MSDFDNGHRLGKWISSARCMYCSECGQVQPGEDAYLRKRKIIKAVKNGDSCAYMYCDRCGARMTKGIEKM